MTRTVPSAPQHIPSDLISPTDYNAYVAPANAFLTNVPIFMGYQATAQLLPVANLPITLDSELVDSDGGHSLTTNPSRYTVQVPGRYAICGVASFAANGNGARIVSIVKNGTVNLGSYIEGLPCASGVSSLPTNLSFAPLNAGDYVELWVFQNSGGSIFTSVTTQATSAMSVWWVAHI